MATTNHPSGEEGGWALVFQQGLPVALCPVTDWDGGALELACEGMEVEPRARVHLQFMASGRSSGTRDQQAAIVKGVQQGRMHLQLEGMG